MWVERRAFEFGGERRRVSVAFEVDAQRRLQDELYQRAYFDPLTALPNRELCDRAVVDLANAGPSGQPFALAVVEIEKFTQINAFHGEAAGDALLQRIAERIAQNLGPEDWLGRSGGDEFCLILPTAPKRRELSRGRSGASSRASPIPSSSKASKSSLRPRRA